MSLAFEFKFGVKIKQRGKTGNCRHLGINIYTQTLNFKRADVNSKYATFKGTFTFSL
jgi:hypothetical protein